MFDNKDLPNIGAQFAISHEALALLRWLVEHHADELKILVKRELHTGLHERIFEDTKSAAPTTTEMQANVVDFFSLMELLLLEAADEYTEQKVRKNKLQPTVDQIDSTLCDTMTVQSSIEHATTKLEDHSESSARELLFKEILKRWTPHKRYLVN